MQHATDWREYLRGQEPGDWTSLWSSVTATVKGMPFDYGHRNWLEFASAAGHSAFTWDAPSGDTGFTDQEVLAHVHVASGSQQPLVGLRLGGAAGSETGYVFGYDTSATWRIWRFAAGVLTSIASGVYASPNDTAYWLRFRVNGTTLEARVWHDGDAWPGADGVEPTTYLMTVVDATYASGAPGLVRPSGLPPTTYFFSVGTNGDAAPVRVPVADYPDSDAAIPRPMEAWARDPTARVELVLELERAHRETGVVDRVYVSRHGKTTAPHDYPPSTVAQPLLAAATLPGMSLADETLFAGDASGAGGVVSFELRNDLGQLDDWRDYTFAGRAAILRAGERGQPLRYCEPVLGGAIDAEPQVGPSRVMVDVRAAPGFLDDALTHRTYVGIPNCLEQLANITPGAAHNAVYQASAFMVGARFRYTASSGGFFAQWVKGSSITNLLFRVALFHSDHATATNRDRFQVHLSSGGVAKALFTPSNTSQPAWNDGEWHWFAFAFQSKDRWYFMVDGVVYAEGSVTYSVDTGNTDTLFLATNFTGDSQDHRLYASFVAEDEARVLMPTRAEPDDRCVGMWRADDNELGTMTDYSATANHITLPGTEDVHWRWSPSDLGAEALAGQPMPIVIGQVHNAPAQLIDTNRFRFRVHDELYSNFYNVETVKSRGTALADPADYASDASGAVFDAVLALDEPVTVDIERNQSPVQFSALPSTVQNVLEFRDELGESRVSAEGFEALSGMMPWVAGWHYTTPPTKREMLQHFLQQSGASYGVDRWGRLSPFFLAPPVNPGPYGIEPLVEFLSSSSGGAYFHPEAGDDSLGVSRFTVAFWFKSHEPAPSPVYSDALPAFNDNTPLVQCCGGANEFPFSGWYVGLDEDRLVFAVPSLSSGSVLRSRAGFFKPGRWYYVVCMKRIGPDTLEMWGAELGSTSLTVLGGQVWTGSYVAPTRPLVIGGGCGNGFWGSVAYLQFYGNQFNDAGVATHFGGDLTTRPSSSRTSLQTYVPMTEGEGDTVGCVLNVGGTGQRDHDGRLYGARWCPRLTLDLRNTALPKLTARRELRPAWKVDARYRKNFSPLTGSDIAAGVSQADRPDLMSPYKSAPAINDQRDTYPDSRVITLDTPLADAAAAQRLAATMLDRFRPGRSIVELERLRREILLLHLSDEVVVYHPRLDLDEGQAFRVVRLSGADLLGLTGNVGLWG